MVDKKAYYYILAILIVVLAGLLLWFLYSLPEPEERAGGRQVPVQAEFDAKIVYTTDQEADVEALRQDCAERGGEFNPCGTICAPEADICASVCAYTCEFDGKNNNGTAGEAGLIEYVNADLGFSLAHPTDLQVEEQDNRVQFTLWGPTQTGATELFDGISLTVRKIEKPAGSDLRELARSDIEENILPIGSVVEPIATTTVNVYPALAYTAQTLGTSRKVYIGHPDEPQTVYQISYSTPDPTDQGYDEIAEMILDSFEII